MLRRILKNVAFTVTIWTVLFVLAEGILRVQQFLPKGAPDAPLSRLVMCRPDPTRIWRYKSLYHQIHKNPEFEVDVRTNEIGLRDRSIESDSNHRAAVLAVGDSFTFGWGVESAERYSERLEDMLGPPGNRVVNAGYWMYSFDQQLLALRELVPRLRPRVVVQGLYAPHLLTLMSHTWERDSSGRLVAVRNPGVRVAEDGSLRFTNQYLENPPFRSRLVGEVFRIWFNWRLSREGMTEDLPLLDPTSTRFALAWRMCEQTIAETASFLKGEGVDYVAFGIPRDLQVSDEEWTEAYRVAVKGRRLDLDLPSRRLGDIVTRSGGAWVDLLPVFRTRYQSDLYFKHDVHWTREGHRLAAEILAPILKKRMEHRSPD